MAKDKGSVITVNAASEARIALLRTILAYESRATGATMGQTLHRIVMRHAEKAGLPEEVAARLAEIDAERTRAAISASLGREALGRTA